MINITNINNNALFNIVSEKAKAMPDKVNIAANNL